MNNSLIRNLATLILCFVLLTLIPVTDVSLASSEKYPARIAKLQQVPVTLMKERATTADIVAGEILIKFKKSASATQIQDVCKYRGAQETGEVKDLRIHRIRIPKGLTAEDAIAMYESMPGVEYAETEKRYYMQQVPNDAYYSDQWDLPVIQAPQAWDITTGGEVIVAVIDTGVDYSHEDLAGKVIKGYDYVNNDSDPMDDESHGTHVAGTIAASTNNGIGIAGMSWSAKILAIKALDSNGSGYDSWVANGITYAADHGAKIINLSLGGPSPSSTLSDAIAYAQSKGCIIVAATGNENTNAAIYPACYQKVIGVGATDRNDVKAPYSNYGWYVDVTAPGGNMDILASNGILSCYLGGGYAWGEGTSMATPHVAGLAALIASRYPGRTGDQLARSVLRAVDDTGTPGRDDIYGYGRINALKAVTSPFTSSEETDTSAVYSGSWSNGSSTNASGGSYKYSSSTSDTVTYAFNGPGVTWVAHRHPSAGKAKVYIDSVYQQDVDLYGNDNYQQLVYTKTGLSDASHTIKVEVAGTKNAGSTGYEVNADAFDVASSDTTSPVTTITASPASPDGNNGWYSSEPTITLTANETATVYYRWDSGADTIYMAPFTAIPGTHTLTVHAIDLAGNAEADHAQQFKVDIAPPGKPEPAVIALPNGNFKANWAASVDTESAIDYYSVSVNGTETTSSNTSHTFTPLPDTTYTVSVKAYDKAGKVSQTSTRTAVSKAVPVINACVGNNLTFALKPVGDTITPDLPQVTVSFASVTSSGETSVSVSSASGLASPSGYNVFGKYYDIETTAAISGQIAVTVPYSAELTPDQEASLKLYHYEGGVWVDRTSGPVDIDNNLITAQTSGLPPSSPFAVCQQQPAPPSGGGGGGGGGGGMADSGTHDTTETSQTPADEPNVNFADITQSHWAYSYVLDLTQRAIIKGYADQTFRPGATVTRAEFAKMICLAMDWPLNTVSQESFSDVTNSSWMYSFVETARAHGAISGYPDGTFKPNKNVTRAEIAKIIAETLNLAPGSSSLNSNLNDIDSSWASEYIKACVNAGIVGGYADNNFRPANTASRAEAAKMIVGVLTSKE